MSLEATRASGNEIGERITAAARGHFLRHGFRAVTMDDLAAEMGMSKKTLYVHFPTKGDLLKAVVLQKVGEFEEAMDAVGAGEPDDFSETLKRLLETMTSSAGEISPAFVRDLAKDAPELILVIKARRREVIGRTFGRILELGQKARAIRRDLEPELMVEILLGMADSVVTPENVAAKGISPGQLISAILLVFLEGVQTPQPLP